MRLLYFSRDYTPHDHRFLTSLAETEHQVFYLRLEQRGADLEDRALPPAVTLVRWAGGRTPATIAKGPALLASLRRVIRQVRPDLIHAGPIQTAGLLAALSGFRPYVAVSWGSDLLRDADRNAFWGWATRFSLSRADALVGDCEPVRHKAIELGFPAEKIVTFPWGVNLEKFQPAMKAPAPNIARPGLEKSLPARDANAAALRERLGWQQSFVLISTRGWEPHYGVVELAQAFVMASREQPELRLLLLGSGSQARHLKQIFLRGGAMERVHFAGQISQNQLPVYFMAADVYVSASHSDGTSISLLEALASGVPALVSDIPGNREWITPGVEGWWFPVGDAQALGKAILAAVDERDTLAEKQQAARALAEARADWRQNFKRLFDAYALALNGHDRVQA